jgi:hypothetical protein
MKIGNTIKLGGGSRLTEQQDAFLRHLWRETIENPIGKGRVYEMQVLIHVRPFNGYIYVSEVRALRGFRRGSGTKAMRYLTTLADTFNVRLQLAPERIGSEGMTNAQLRKWYRRFGFVNSKQDSGTMIREAVRPASLQEAR